MFCVAGTDPSHPLDYCNSPEMTATLQGVCKARSKTEELSTRTECAAEDCAGLQGVCSAPAGVAAASAGVTAPQRPGGRWPRTCPSPSPALPETCSVSGHGCLCHGKRRPSVEILTAWHTGEMVDAAPSPPQRSPSGALAGPGSSSSGPPHQQR